MVSVADYSYAMLRILTRTTLSSTFILVLLFVVVMLSVMHQSVTKVGNVYSVGDPSLEFPDYERANTVVGTTWNVQRFTDILSKDVTCKRDILLLVLVTSAPENFERRRSIRNTWASRSGDGSTPWQVVFLLGKTYQVTQILLDDEIERHDDIFQGDFIDSYRNLTLKVQTGFSWAAKTCQPQYVLKTDDDCFVNVKLLAHFLMNHNTITNKLYAGNLLRSLDVIRRDDSKWRVSKDVYAPEQYPPYASGSGYILSGDSLQRVVDAAAHIKLIPVEDAYTGVVADYLKLPLIDTGRMTLFNVNWNACNYRYLFVVHHISPEQQFICQNYTIESEVKCADQKEITRWD